MTKGVKTKLHLKWNIDKNKYYLYLDGQKICRLDEAQWMLIAIYFDNKTLTIKEMKKMSKMNEKWLEENYPTPPQQEEAND